MFHPTLTFDCHISALTASCISKLAQINRAKYAFNSDLLAILINALVFCKLFYCSAVFPGLPHTQATRGQVAGRVTRNSQQLNIP